MPCHAVADVVLRQPNLWLPQSPITKPPHKHLCPRPSGSSARPSRAADPRTAGAARIRHISPQRSLDVPCRAQGERQRGTNPLPAKWLKSYKSRAPPLRGRCRSTPSADMHVSSTAARTGTWAGAMGREGLPPSLFVFDSGVAAGWSPSTPVRAHKVGVPRPAAHLSCLSSDACR